MIEIGFKNVKKNFGDKEVLKSINFEIKSNEHVAIIGKNGCGKTTIFNLICGYDMPTSGSITIRKNSVLKILNQQPCQELNSKLVKDILFDSFELINRLKSKLTKAEEKMLKSSGEDQEKVIMAYSKLQEEFINAGGYEVNTKIDKITNAFKVSSLLDKYYRELSGGEKTIINLISLILQEPDILLLDEPTNHLDISSVEWLEDFIKNYKKTILIVSHDRYFLDSVADKIILIEDGKEEIFNGNYSYYLKENEKRVMNEFNNYKNQQKLIEAMKNSIKRLREFGRLAYPCGERFFRRAANIERRLEKIELLDKPNKEEKISLKFNIEKNYSKDVIEISNFNFSIKGKELFKNANMSIKQKEKVFLMGNNGTGKSSLIKQILNDNINIKKGPSIKIGYISQEVNFIDENLNILEEASKYFYGPEEYLRSALSKFLFYEDGVFIKLKKLSGGERLRLKLFCLMQENNNLLILDEPTNHIDIPTKEVLEEALKSYEGTLLIISHDRYFINKIATRIVMIENKKLVSYIGNYEDYKHIKNKQ